MISAAMISVSHGQCSHGQCSTDQSAMVSAAMISAAMIDQSGMVSEFKVDNENKRKPDVSGKTKDCEEGRRKPKRVKETERTK